jgi:hypothetical protein
MKQHLKPLKVAQNVLGWGEGLERVAEFLGAADRVGADEVGGHEGFQAVE